jgi:hypothetical protein
MARFRAPGLARAKKHTSGVITGVGLRAPGPEHRAIRSHRGARKNDGAIKRAALESGMEKAAIGAGKGALAGAGLGALFGKKEHKKKAIGFMAGSGAVIGHALKGGGGRPQGPHSVRKPVEYGDDTRP